MNVFLDTSVVLRLLMSEPDPLEGWSEIDEAYASRLLLLEVRRATDRARLLGRINDDDVAALREETRRLLDSIEVLALTDDVLEGASGPLPTVLGALDAIHLASALEIQRRREPALVLATHDVALARAARASGLPVIGVSAEQI